MGDIINMQDIKNGKIQSVEWVHMKTRKDGTTYPSKIWENLEQILKKHNIEIKYNLITKEMECNIKTNKMRTLVTKIYTLNVKENLDMTKEEIIDSMHYIAEENAYNPFVDLMVENQNHNYGLINELFKCIYINDDNKENYDYYFTLFTKWCLNVVKMAHNTKRNKYRAAGILVLQGEQGCRKTTFVESLMPISEWCNCDKSFYPDRTDSVIENTKYILVEWGELDDTLKSDQSKIKQFITSAADEYRVPYGRFSEKYPRITSFVGTVNSDGFLRDETGARRFWIIPVLGFDFKKLEAIDKKELWGAVYSLWKSKKIKDYLEKDEMDKLNEVNRKYYLKNDISYIIDEKIKWDMPKEEWCVYGVTDIADYLMIKENKKIRTELEKRGLKYASHRTKNGNVKKGFKLPRFEVKLIY